MDIVAKRIAASNDLARMRHAPGSCCSDTSREYRSDVKAWHSPGWRALGFSPLGSSHRYSYEIKVSETSPKSITIMAYCPLRFLYNQFIYRIEASESLSHTNVTEAIVNLNVLRGARSCSQTKYRPHWLISSLSTKRSFVQSKPTLSSSPLTLTSDVSICDSI